MKNDADVVSDHTSNEWVSLTSVSTAKVIWTEQLEVSRLAQERYAMARNWPSSHQLVNWSSSHLKWRQVDMDTLISSSPWYKWHNTTYYITQHNTTYYSTQQNTAYYTIYLGYLGPSRIFWWNHILMIPHWMNLMACFWKASIGNTVWTAARAATEAAPWPIEIDKLKEILKTRTIADKDCGDWKAQKMTPFVKYKMEMTRKPND